MNVTSYMNMNETIILESIHPSSSVFQKCHRNAEIRTDAIRTDKGRSPNRPIRARPLGGSLCRSGKSPPTPRPVSVSGSDDHGQGDPADGDCGGPEQPFPGDAP